MPNPISSAVQDIVTNAITSKILGGNSNSNSHPQPNHHSSGQGGLFGKISSTISSAINPHHNQQQQPMQQGGGYPQQQQGGGYYGGGGYPPQQQQQGGGAYPGYPPNQPYGQQQPSAPPPQSGGYPGYPQQQQQQYPAYPPPDAQNLGYQPPQMGGSIGFNVDYPPPSSGYQPYGGGSAPYPTASQGGAPYPSAAAAPPYPTTGGYSQQPTQFGTGYAPPHSSSGPGYPPANYGAPPQHQPQYQQQPQQHWGPPPAMATPSVRPNPQFNAQNTAEVLRKAMKGFGCDKGKVIQALVNCSNAQRQEVIRVFKQMYGKDLLNELRGELHGDFEDLILALMEYPARYDAQQLRRAMEGFGTKEHVLIEIMTTRSNVQIYEIKMAYRQMYGGDLERDLIGETSGHFKRLLVALCSGARDESFNADPLKANQDAKKLWRAGEARLGTDESTFNAVLAAQNYAQLRLVFDEYAKVSGHSIEQAIHAEFSGDIKDGLLAVVKSIKNRPAYFAELLYQSMRGIGTRDTDLIRLVVSRSEIDLGDVRQAYQRMYNTPLENAIASDCSGAYKDGLIALVKGYYH